MYAFYQLIFCHFVQLVPLHLPQLRQTLRHSYYIVWQLSEIKVTIQSLSSGVITRNKLSQLTL